MKKVLTPTFRVSFPEVFEPKSFQEGQEPKYSVQMVFDKTEDLSKLKTLIQETAKEKWGDKVPKKLRTPLRDGDVDKEGNPNYEGKVFVNASSKFKPGVVDQALNEIISKDEFYPGCYARATVNCYAYDYMGNCGLSLGLQNIQKVRDGERLDSVVDAASDFEAIVEANEVNGDFTL